MQFQQLRGELYIPDGTEETLALKRCSHMGIGAHQDDLEIMAFHGILECYEDRDSWFCGVTCTDGSGGPRKEGLEDLEPIGISELRNKEQKKAADLGRYGALAQFNFPSSSVKGADKTVFVEDLLKVMTIARPKVIYTHNPADKHDTHVGVLIGTLMAIHKMPNEDRPEKLYGCEVWRDLDWLDEADKVRLNVTGYDELASELINCHDSQVTTAKRYDLATIGRRRANATYSDAHSNSIEKYVTYALDLSELIQDESVNLKDFVVAKIQAFEKNVNQTISGQLDVLGI